MKILLIGENPRVPSGFGMQLDMLARGFCKLDNEVIVLANNGPSYSESGLTVWHDWEINNIEHLDENIYKISPDVIIIFYYSQLLIDAGRLINSPKNCPILMWLPWEGTTLPFAADNYFKGVPKNTVVHLSEFGQKLWKDVAPSEHVIPHGIDCDVFKLPTSTRRNLQRRLRRKWSEKLKFPLFNDSLLILNLDRNIWHKRWDCTFDYIRRLKEKCPKKTVQLIAHTVVSGDGKQGVGDLPALAKIYGISENVCFTGFHWGAGLSKEDLVELYYMCDFRLSTSTGEGFGVPIIEAAACGTPQILNKTTTIPELLGDDYAGAIEPSSFEEKVGALWGTPDVESMVTMTLNQYENYDVVIEKCVGVSEKVVSRYDEDRIAKQWHDLLVDKVVSSGNLWYDCRWGWTNRFSVYGMMERLPVVIKKLMDFPKTVEIGSFDGKFIQASMEHGLNVEGVEEDSKAYELCSNLSKLSIHNRPFLADWPQGDVLVITSAFDLIYHWGAQEGLSAAYDRFKDYKWIVILRELTYRWHYMAVHPEDIEKHLSESHERRSDLETVVQTTLDKEFKHEIWELDGDTSNIPKGFGL
jgi:glycosyltransferase involved in cell wall biosynthesis